MLASRTARIFCKFYSSESIIITLGNFFFCFSFFFMRLGIFSMNAVIRFLAHFFIRVQYLCICRQPLKPELTCSCKRNKERKLYQQHVSFFFFVFRSTRFNTRIHTHYLAFYVFFRCRRFFVCIEHVCSTYTSARKNCIFLSGLMFGTYIAKLRFVAGFQGIFCQR